MSVNAIQRPVTFPARFDIKRIADITNLSKKGPRSGRYVEIFPPSLNPMDHSMDAGDLLFQLKDQRGVMSDRYIDAERRKPGQSQQPAVSVNLRGSTIEQEVYDKYCGTDLYNENAMKKRAFRDQIVCVGVTKYNCLYAPGTPEGQKDPAAMVGGTMESLAQHQMKCGDFLVWDVPNPGKKQRVGSRDIKGLDKFRLELVPVRDNARVTIEALVYWCERANSDEAKKRFTDKDPTLWVEAMRSYVLNDANHFWTIEGEYLLLMASAESQFQKTYSRLTVHKESDIQMCGGFTSLLLTIHRAKQLKASANVELKDVFYGYVNNVQFAQIAALLDCMGRAVGRTTSSAEVGGYVDWIVEFM